MHVGVKEMKSTITEHMLENERVCSRLGLSRTGIKMC